MHLMADFCRFRHFSHTHKNLSNMLSSSIAFRPMRMSALISRLCRMCASTLIHCVHMLSSAVDSHPTEIQRSACSFRLCLAGMPFDQHFSYGVRLSFLLLVWLCVSLAHRLPSHSHRITSHTFPQCRTKLNRRTEKCSGISTGTSDNLSK